MHRWRSMAAAATLAAALSVGACGGSGTGAAGETNDALGWTDKVCGALLKFTEAAGTQPTIDRSTPAADIQSRSAYLGTAADGAQQALTGLDEAGRSPVSGGDEIISKLKELLLKVKTTFSDVKAKLDAINTSDPTSLQTVPAALAPLLELAGSNPATGLQGNAELYKAAQQAPNCQKAGVTAASTAPTS